jgi:hypothetical protein
MSVYFSRLNDLIITGKKIKRMNATTMKKNQSTNPGDFNLKYIRYILPFNWEKKWKKYYNQ